MASVSSVSSSSTSATLPTLRLDRAEVSRSIAAASSRLAILGLLMFRLRYALTRLPMDELDKVLDKFSTLMVRGLRRAAFRDGDVSGELLLEGRLAPSSPCRSTVGAFRVLPAEPALDDSSFKTPSIMHVFSLLLVVLMMDIL